MDKKVCSPGKLSSAQRWEYVKENCYKLNCYRSEMKKTFRKQHQCEFKN